MSATRPRPTSHGQPRECYSLREVLRGFVACRLRVISLIPELPGILRQVRSGFEVPSECCIDSDALLSELREVVRLAKRFVVPREEGFDGFFGALPCMKAGVSCERRVGNEGVPSRGQVLTGLRQPCQRVRPSRVLRLRDRGASLLGGQFPVGMPSAPGEPRTSFACR